MSRRKQPNPKPAKRDTELEELAQHLNLPADQLYLKQSNENNSGYSVLAKEDLSSGTVLGVYKGRVQDDASTLQNGQAVIKVSRFDGDCPIHVMIDDEGHWLKLMRKAALPPEANICLRISAGRIFCTVTSDITREVELQFTCQIPDQIHDNLSSDNASLIKNTTLKDEEQFDSSGDAIKLEKSPIHRQSPTIMLDSGSSSEDTMALRNSEINYEDRGSNLDDVGDDCRRENHKDHLETASSDEAGNDRQKIKKTDQEDPTSSNHIYRRRGSSRSPDSDAIPNSRDDPRIFRCPLCKFFCYQHYAYEKHMRSHHSPSRNTQNRTNPNSFCETCKIQFMSVKTYHVHKEYYCMTRNEIQDAMSSPSEPEPSPPIIKTSGDALILNGATHGSAGMSSVIHPQAIFAAISTNPLILLPCAIVSGQGLVPQSGIISSGMQGYVLKSGNTGAPVLEKVQEQVKPVKDDQSEGLSKHPHQGAPPQKRKISEGNVVNLKKSCLDDEYKSSLEVSSDNQEESETDQEAPLDLSVKCTKTSLLKRPKRRNSSVTTDHPSPPHFETTSSPYPYTISRNVTSPTSFSNDATGLISSETIPVQRRVSSDRMSPLPPTFQTSEKNSTGVLPIGMPPPKLLKQGNNICEECNIVFYKYDNYLAHKKHYCAFRRRQLSALLEQQSSDDANSNHSEPSSKEFSSSEEPKSSMKRMEYSPDYLRPSKSQRSVYCCDVCGVKFSTSDNLNAHQTYYCNKTGEGLLHKPGGVPYRKKSVPEIDLEEWKCNYCDATCSSYDAIRRHLLTHNELRGFRCMVCGYKGNTLRGMRTHACEHLNGDTSSVEDFVTKSVIVESGGIPLMSRTVECSDDDSDSAKDNRVVVDGPSEDLSSGEAKRLKQEHSAVEQSESERSMSPSDHVMRPLKGYSSDNDSNSQNCIHSDEPSTPNATSKSMVFNDAAIKRESSPLDVEDEVSNEEPRKSVIKTEPEPEPEEEYENRSSSPPTASTVIRGLESENGVKKKSRKNCGQGKSSTDVKYCRSCGVSFYHLSNFIAHKKFYCVSRVMESFNQEAAPVQ